MGGESGLAVEARTVLRDLPSGSDRVATEWIVGHDPGADVVARVQRAFGPLGTLLIEAGVGARLGDQPVARACVGVRGSIGPVAARFEAAWTGAPTQRFDPLADGGREAFGAEASATLEGSGRVSAAWLIDGAIAVRTDVAGRWVGDLDAGVRGRRLLAPTWDATASGYVRTGPDGRGRIGVGVGVVHVPRRAPEIALGLHLDGRGEADRVAWSLGFASRGTWPLEDGGRLGWTARVRPFGREATPYRVEATWRPSASVTAPVAAVGVRGGDGAGWAWTAAWAWSGDLVGDVWRVP
ncbi:MAG: hypothetical protein WD336_07075 [Trueperaceae bacterium]